MSPVTRAILCFLGYVLVIELFLWTARFAIKFGLMSSESSNLFLLIIASVASATFVFGILIFGLVQKPTWRKELLGYAMTGFFSAVVFLGLLPLLQSEEFSLAYEVFFAIVIALLVAGVDYAMKTMGPKYYR